MIDRCAFIPDGTNPNYPVVISPYCTVPTEDMALRLASLLGPAEKVLEIGTGSGYQTAILAERCKEVVSIEVQPPTGLLQEELPANVSLVKADGCTYDTGEQFDAVLVTFTAPRIMRSWVTQLREGGRLVAPMKVGATCRICLYEKRGPVMELRDVAGYANFTPMIEGEGAPCLDNHRSTST